MVIMTYRLTKRTGPENNHAFPALDFQSLEECLIAAKADAYDFVVEDDQGVVNYRIDGVWKA
jgi:hypothetical protein